MGEARRRKKQDSNFGKVRQRLKNGSFTNPFNSLREFVEYHTAQKGRGYLACGENGCCYYGKDDYVGDEEEVVLENIETYDPQKEVIFVQQTLPGDSIFESRIIPLTKLDTV